MIPKALRHLLSSHFCFPFQILLSPSLSAASLEESRLAQKDQQDNRVLLTHTCTHTLVFTLAQTHTYICRDTLIQLNVCVCEPLVNNRICPPPQMPAQDQETMVRLLTVFSSLFQTPFVLLSVFFSGYAMKPCLQLRSRNNT